MNIKQVYELLDQEIKFMEEYPTHYAMRCVMGVDTEFKTLGEACAILAYLKQFKCKLQNIETVELMGKKVA